MYSFH